MWTKNYVILFAFSFISISCDFQKEEITSGQYNEIITKNTKIEHFYSEEVGDSFYIYVRLPKNYASTEKRYPVLYLLDGDISFNMATSIVRYLQYGKDLPEMIIIAPAYGTMLSDKETNHRERDYTFSNIDRFEESGGGQNYLNFLKKELMPHVDSTYRTNDFRVINGYSLGGLLVIKSLLYEPEMFDGYIAGSPYLINDQKKIIEKISSLLGFIEEKKLFITVGETEEKSLYHIPILSIYTKLKDISNISIAFTEFENGSHFTCPSEALTYGLRYVFKSRIVKEP